MGRPKQWTEIEVKDGIQTITIDSWKYYYSYICDNMLDNKSYIWRGQRCYNWKLEPTLDRILKKKDKAESNSLRKLHLRNFKYAARGRRGTNPVDLKEENDWWALGQHFGLATPLLDWTTSPFVAAYFAFSEENDRNSKKRAIFALNRNKIAEKSNDLISNFNAKDYQEDFLDSKLQEPIKFISPLSDENPRLVNQGGLFSKAPDAIDIETWVKFNFKNNTEPILRKFTLPDSQRETCLRLLNRMNINHLTLFPDLYGASNFSNLELEIDRY